MKKSLFILSLAAAFGLATSCSSSPEVPSAQSVVDEVIQKEATKFTDTNTILGEYAVVYQQSVDAYLTAYHSYDSLFNYTMENGKDDMRQQVIEQRDQVKKLVENHYNPLLVKAAEAIANKTIPCEVRSPLTAATLYVEPFEINDGMVYNDSKVKIHCNISSTEWVNAVNVKLSFYNADNQLVAEIPLTESSIYEGQFSKISSTNNTLEGVRKTDIDDLLTATKVILTQTPKPGPRTIF